ncbi:MAG: TIGR04211 family SH3 domain-containing protein [Thermodesulfobacteriota bacterium]
MKKTRLFTILFLSTLLISPLLARAAGESHYITDVLVVNVRAEPDRAAKIINRVRSGNSIEVLEKGKDGFVRIVTPKGAEGWVADRFVTRQTPKIKTIAKLKEKTRQLEIALRQDNKGDMIVADKELVARLKKLETQLADSEGRYATIKEKADGVNEAYAMRDDLLSQQNDLQQKIAFLEDENDNLVQTGRILWFLAGFGVFSLGWIMGKIGRRQRHSSSLSM